MAPSIAVVQFPKSLQLFVTRGLYAMLLCPVLFQQFEQIPYPLVDGAI